MNKLLIVDDERNIVMVLKEYAEFNGFSVDCAYDGAEAVEMLEHNNYDCVIMDIMMPKMDGFEAVRALKDIKNTPVIMMSARTQEEDKLQGFELGIDDYVTKPFSPKEVIARIKAVLKRTQGYLEFAEIDEISLDRTYKRILVKGQDVHATAKEFDLLETLIRNKGIVVPREKLLNEVWGFDYDGDERTVDTHIKMLRAHLGDFAKYIKTSRGIGYEFSVEGDE
ncbi:MAG: response regulator transcription factor [Clostridia bacterium]|nr:response regulator transcription factor [Clostridia bacterium]